MNLTHKLRFFVAALFAMTFALACSTDDADTDTEGETGGETGGTTEFVSDAFTLTLSGNDVDYLALKVVVSDEYGSGNYVVGVITSSDFEGTYGSSLTAAADAVTAELSSSVDFAAADSKYVFSTSQTVDVASAWDLLGGETYVVLVYGVDINGTQTTGVAYKTVTMSRDSLYSTDYCGIVYINEVDPNNNIIELYSSATFNVPCTNFVITNKAEESTTFSCEITAGGYYLLENFSVNPMGDSLVLYDGDGLIVDEVEISSVANGSTYGRETDGASTWKEFTSDNTTLGSGNGKIATTGAAFTVDLLYTTTDQIALAVTPSADVESYYYTYGYCAKSTFSSYYGNSYDALVADFAEYFYYDKEADLALYNGMIIFGGSDAEGTEIISLKDYWALDANTEYIVAVAAIDEVGNVITDAVYVEATTSGTYTSTDASYNQWLGTWTFTSTSSYNGSPVSFDVTISQQVADYSYYIVGWELSKYRSQGYGYRAYYNASTSGFYTMYGEFMSYVSENDGWPVTGYIFGGCLSYIDAAVYAGTPYIITGSYPSFGVAMNSDGTATATGYTWGTSIGYDFTPIHQMLFITDYAGENFYNFYYDDAYADENEPVGPYTMVKSSSSAPAAAPAASAASVSGKTPRLMNDVINNAVNQKISYKDVISIK